MTHSADTPALTGEPSGQPQRRGDEGRPRPWDERAWVPLIPAAVTLAVVAYQVGNSSLWRDEGATLAAVKRTLPQMFRMLGNIDVVHGSYYLLMWFWVRVAGTGVVALRFPSMVAMAVVAAVLTMIGRRLVSGHAGLAAGLAYAALPIVSRYAHNARPYAMVTAEATIATYLLVRATEPGARWRRWLVAYGAAIALLGLGNLFALLLVPVHAIALVVWLRQRGDGASPREPLWSRPEARAVARGWLAAVVAAGVVVSPVAVIAWGERAQVSWIKTPKLKTVVGLGGLIGEPAMIATVVAVIAISVGYASLRGPGGLRAAWPPRLVALAAGWLALPSALLLAVSLIHPYFALRYVIFCVPAVALLAGTALAALGRVVGVVALVAVVAVSLPDQVHVRRASAFGENLRRLSRILAVHARPGDSILFAGRNTREFEYAYPGPYRKLRDVGLGRNAIESSTLTGTNAPPAVIRARLATVDRLWAIETGKQSGPVPVLHGLGFTPQRRWSVTGVRLVLLTRNGG